MVKSSTWLTSGFALLGAVTVGTFLWFFLRDAPLPENALLIVFLASLVALPALGYGLFHLDPFVRVPKKGRGVVAFIFGLLIICSAYYIFGTTCAAFGLLG